MTSNVTALPKASHASIDEVMNVLEFHTPAINDAVAFALTFDGDMADCVNEIAQRWPQFGLVEVTIMNMIVSAVLEDRISQTQAM